MRFVRHTDTSNGYRAVVHLSLDELKLVRNMVSRTKPSFRSRMDRLLNKHGHAGRSNDDYNRLRQLSKPLHDAIEKLDWLQKRRNEGRKS